MPEPRLALLCGGASLDHWHVACLDQLGGVATLTALIVAPEQHLGADGASSPLRRYARRMEGRARVDVSDRFGGLPRARASSAEELAALPEFDAVLRLGRHAIPAGLRAELGVWSFPHEDRGDELAFLTEVYDGSDVTRVALACTATDGTQVIVDEGYLPTAKRSYRVNRALALGFAEQLPRRACERLQAGIEWRRGVGEAGAGAAPVARRLRLSGFLIRLAWRRLALAWTRLFRHPQWNVGILRTPVASLLESGYHERDIEWFPLRGRRTFLSDPFGVLEGDVITILCERYSYRESKGHIAALERSPSGFVASERPAIALSTHMSYPYLVEQPDGVYCIPETSDEGEVAALVTTRFPDEWRWASALLPDVAGVDPTLFRHDGRWWLTTGRKGPYEDVELYVWHAPELAGPWTPHAVNPVKADVRCSRPGGRPFEHEGSLYRPAQDCSRRYGSRIALQRLIRLAPTEFVEETVRVIEAGPRDRLPVGPHTLTLLSDDLALVDACRTRFVWDAFVAFVGIWARNAASRAPQKLSKSPNV